MKQAYKLTAYLTTTRAKNKEKVTALIAIKSELAEQNYQEVTSVNEVVDEAHSRITARNYSVFNRSYDKKRTQAGNDDA